MRLSDTPARDRISVTHDADSETYLVRFDSDAIAPSMAVVEAMASVLETSPTDLDPLVGTIDPGAIDRLVKGSDGGDDRALEFRYLDHVVTVRGQGVVEISSATADD
jgi:hypothetical protein